MRTLKQTNDLQKDIMKEMNVETIDDMMDEMEENKFLQEEFSDAIQRNYDVDVDEAELDDELEQLDYEMKIELDNDKLNVPNKKVMSKKEMDEKNLEEFMVHK